MLGLQFVLLCFVKRGDGWCRWAMVQVGSAVEVTQHICVGSSIACVVG